MFFQKPNVFPNRKIGLELFGVDDRLFGQVQKAVNSPKKSERQLNKLIDECRAAIHNLDQRRALAGTVSATEVPEVTAYFTAIDNVKSALASCIDTMEARKQLPF